MQHGVGQHILLFSPLTCMLILIQAELEKRKLRWVELTGQSQSGWPDSRSRRIHHGHRALYRYDQMMDTICGATVCSQREIDYKRR